MSYQSHDVIRISVHLKKQHRYGRCKHHSLLFSSFFHIKQTEFSVHMHLNLLLCTLLLSIHSGYPETNFLALGTRLHRKELSPRLSAYSGLLSLHSGRHWAILLAKVQEKVNCRFLQPTDLFRSTPTLTATFLFVLTTSPSWTASLKPALKPIPTGTPLM